MTNKLRKRSSLYRAGFETTVVKLLPQVLPTMLDVTMVIMVQNILGEKGTREGLLKKSLAGTNPSLALPTSFLFKLGF